MSLSEKLEEHRARKAKALSKDENGVLKRVMLMEEAESLKAMAVGIEQLRRAAIARAILDGIPGHEIAEIFDITPGRVSQIKKEVFGRM